MSTEEDDLAAAWGAELEAEGEGGGETAGVVAPAIQVEPARVLNQAEIDSLLGFDGGPDGSEQISGMQRIISSGLISYERLPMLEIVFDRLVRIMSTSLRNFTSDNVEVSIDNIVSLRFGDYLNSIPLPAMLAVFKAEEWDNYGLMVIDSAMIYSIVDVLLGGRRGTAAMRIEGRPYTTIERNLVERLIHVVLADLPGDVPVRTVGGESTFCGHFQAFQRRRAGKAANRHGRSRRPAGASAALRHAGAGA
jgi:flagellar motor switch protein FliM